MRVNLGNYENQEVRELSRALELALGRIRIDDALIIGGGTVIKKHLCATREAVADTDYSTSPVADAATFTITVTGAVPGDAVFVTPDDSPGDLVWSGYVSANDEITVVVANPTGAGVTPATVNWRASVWQY
jgi:hypothetical protein